MQTRTEPENSPNIHLDSLEILESDSSPAFVIEIGAAVLQFELLYVNKALRNTELRNVVTAEDTKALRFRSWAQTLGRASELSYDFAGWSWSAVLVGKDETLKLVTGTPASSSALSPPAIQNQHRKDLATENAGPTLKSRSTVHTQSREDFIKDLKTNRSFLLQDLPRTNPSVQWEGIQTMLEMSDVGVFEYNPEGVLMYANEAWYRQRSVFSTYRHSGC